MSCFHRMACRCRVLKGGFFSSQLLTDAHVEESGDTYMYQKTAKDLFGTDDWRNAVCGASSRIARLVIRRSTRSIQGK